MIKKKLLAIHLNEFNYKFLRHGAKKYNCLNIIKLLKYKKIETYSKNKIQDKDLDPWVQTVTMNTGKSANIHKIYKTGQSIPNNLIQIWDVLSNRKINSAIWGTMNTNFRDSPQIKVFFPDPWNKQIKIKPLLLENAYKLPRSYAENYTDFKILKNSINIIKFISICVRLISFINLIKITKIFIQTFLLRGLKNYNLFFLFDLISIFIFENLIKHKKINYSHIFLNSLAHFQHNNWDEVENHKIYFQYTDAISKKILDLSIDYDQVFIYNGFTQRKIKTEYLLRPINPKKFFKDIGIKFKRLNTNMTNGGIFEFKSKSDMNLCNKKLKEFNIFGYYFFEVKKLTGDKIFYRIQVKTFKKICKNDSIKFIKKNIDYDTKRNLSLSKNKNYNIDIFEKFKFLKTTGKHYFKGHLLIKKNLINKKKIENRKIFELINNFFKL